MTQLNRHQINHLVSDAQYRAAERIKDALRTASPYLSLLGEDNAQNRKLAAEIIGLPCNTDSYVFVTPGMGLDAMGFVIVPIPATPEEANLLMSSARAYAALIQVKIEAWLASEQAKAEKIAAEFDAAAL